MNTQVSCLLSKLAELSILTSFKRWSFFKISRGGSIGHFFLFKHQVLSVFSGGGWVGRSAYCLKYHEYFILEYFADFNGWHGLINVRKPPSQYTFAFCRYCIIFGSFLVAFYQKRN